MGSLPAIRGLAIKAMNSIASGWSFGGGRGFAFSSGLCCFVFLYSFWLKARKERKELKEGWSLERFCLAI